MWTLTEWYPGDRLLDVFLIVALGVALLSSVAWVVSWRLPGRPATRHLVLVSSLLCCLGMPLLAWVFAASGWTLIAIPILPSRDADRARVMAAGPRIAAAPQQFAAPAGNGRLSPKTEALESEMTEVEPGSSIPHPSSSLRWLGSLSVRPESRRECPIGNERSNVAPGVFPSAAPLRSS